jgi:hypothetical protein
VEAGSERVLPRTVAIMLASSPEFRQTQVLARVEAVATKLQMLQARVVSF